MVDLSYGDYNEEGDQDIKKDYSIKAVIGK